MKKHIQSFVLTLAGGVVALSPLAGQAQPQEYPRADYTSPSYHERGFYLEASPGVAVTRDTELKEFFGPVPDGSKVEFDPGARARFAGGYQFCEWFALEAETGIIANRIRDITGATQVDDVSLANFPLLFNVRFQGPKDAVVSPYIGAGAGFSTSVLSADDLDVNGIHYDGEMADSVFAYQAFAGLRFRINHRMGLSVAYHYFVTADPKWDAEVTFGTATDNVRFGGAQTHSISVVFDFKF